MEEVFQLIQKRDGKIVKFEKEKITNAIFKAAQAVGGRDRKLAERLADKVVQYLYKIYGSHIPHVEEVQDAVEKILIENGHATTAKAYILYRNNRARIRASKSELAGIGVEQILAQSRKYKDTTDLAIFVRTSEEDIVKWDRKRIVDALIREADLLPELAERISLEVEEQIMGGKVRVITAPLIRELVDAKLIEYGLEEARRRHSRLGVPLYDAERIIVYPNKENANIPHNPEATNLMLAETIKKEFALLKVFSQDVADAHIRGDIHLHDLGFVDRPYSFYGSETILLRKGEEVGVTSFKDLFENIPLKYEENGLEIALLKDMDVYDLNGWTGIKRVVRHRANKKMLWIRTENGRSLIVTADHPMVIKKERTEIIPASELKLGDTLITPTFVLSPRKDSLNLVQLLIEANRTEEYLVSRVKILVPEDIAIENPPLKMVKEHLDQGYYSLKDLEGDYIYLKDSLRKEQMLPVKWQLTPELCWFIGYFIAEGHYEHNGLSFVGKNDEVWDCLKRILSNLKINFSERQHGNGCQKIRIHSKLLHDVFLYGLKVGKLAKNKSLPTDCINWKDKYLFSLLSGIIDGDGTLRNKWRTRILIRVASRTLINQIQHVLLSRGLKGNTRFCGLGSIREYKGRQIEQRLPLFGIEFGLDEYFSKYMSLCLKLKEFKPLDRRGIKEGTASPIVKIQEIPLSENYVYDITTESGTFLCNGILAHNCSGQSLEYVKKFGLDLPRALSIAKPARHAETLLAHMVKFSAALQGHFAGAIGWDAVNIYFAPYLEELSDRDVKQLAQMLIFEYSQQAVARGGQAIFSDINLYWEVPDHLKNVPAIGPGGGYTGRTYGDYIKESQRFLWFLFDVYKEGDGAGRPFFFPKPLVHITEKFFTTPGHEEFLNHISDVASDKGNTYFVFDRNGTARISECCRLSFKLEEQDLADAQEPWKMRYSAIQNITLNLPRIAYQAGGKDEELFERLTKLLELAVEGHLQKRAFIERLLTLGPNGPLSLLTMKRDGQPYLRMHRATYLIGILGLNEMVQAHLGEQLHESDEAFKFGLTVIAHLKFVAEEMSKKYGMRFVLEQTPAESVAYRLARLDMEHYPHKAISAVKGNLERKEIYYTNSTYLNISEAMDPIERVRKEGLFHPLIEAGALSHLWIADSRPPKESIANFVIKTFRHTQNAQIAFSPEFTSCNDCGKVARGLSPICPHCSSTNVDGITRVTGYFSKTSGWNRGKIGELKDRYRNKEYFI